MKNYLKKKLEDICVAILSRLNPLRLKKLTIVSKIMIEIEGFIPDDDHWHDAWIACNFQARIIGPTIKKEIILDDLIVLLDNKVVARTDPPPQSMFKQRIK